MDIVIFVISLLIFTLPLAAGTTDEVKKFTFLAHEVNKISSMMVKVIMEKEDLIQDEDFANFMVVFLKNVKKLRASWIWWSI